MLVARRAKTLLEAGPMLVLFGVGAAIVTGADLPVDGATAAGPPPVVTS